MFFMVFFVTTSLGFSQHTFEFTIQDTLTDQVIYDVIELSDGSYILTSQEIFPSSNQKAHLYRISASGKLLDSTTLTYQGQRSGLGNIAQIEPNKFVLAGFTRVNERPVLWLYEMDSLFTGIRSKIMSIDTFDVNNVSDLLIHNNHIICVGTVMKEFFPYPFIYKISPSFDSLQLQVMTEYLSLFPSCLLPKLNNKGYYWFLVASGLPKTLGMFDLDTSFAIKNISGVSNDIFNFHSAKWISKSSMIYCGRYDPKTSPSVWSIGMLKMDTLANITDEYYLGAVDTFECPGLLSRIDFIDTNTIFIGGTHNFYPGSEFGPVNCWFSLTQMDTSFHVNWRYFYGGDANYTMYGIKATTDGGCLMFGSRYNYNEPRDERDIYVYKVDQNGLITGTDDKPGLMAHHTIIYPNPGSDYLIVQTGPQIAGSRFFLKDLTGKTIVNKPIRDPYLTIHSQMIPAGIYLWQITDENVVIESGKWIKK